MFCPNCGKDLPENIVFCTNCGTKITATSPAPTPTPDPFGTTPVGAPVFTGFDVLKRVFSSPLFLTLSILISVGAAAKLCDFTLDVFAILATIACWIIYANAISATEPLKQTGYKLAHVTSSIAFVFNWVIFGLTVFAFVLMLICTALYSTIMTDPATTAELNNAFIDILDSLAAELPADLFAEITSFLTIEFFITFFILATVILAVVAVALAVVNLCLVKHVKNYFKELSHGFVTGNVTVYNKSLATRLLVFGIIGAVFALGSVLTNLFSYPISAISTACLAAAPIFGSALINSAKNDIR